MISAFHTHSRWNILHICVISMLTCVVLGVLPLTFDIILLFSIFFWILSNARHTTCAMWCDILMKLHIRMCSFIWVYVQFPWNCTYGCAVYVQFRGNCTYACAVSCAIWMKLNWNWTYVFVVSYKTKHTHVHFHWNWTYTCAVSCAVSVKFHWNWTCFELKLRTALSLNKAK